MSGGAHVPAHRAQVGITVQEIREAINAGEIIDDYPNDKYGPSCLIFGMTADKRPLHIQCSYPSRPLVKLVTLYEPDEDLWMVYRVRKQQNAG